VDVHTGCL